MAETDFTDDMLMRYADGELDEATASAIDRAMAADDALAERVGVFIETRALAQSALGPLIDEPVPAALTASVERMIALNRGGREAHPGGTPDAGTRPASNIGVVPFPTRPQRMRDAGWLLPLAASVAAVLGGLCGYWLSAGPSPTPAGLQVAGIGNPALADALATAPSGTEVLLGETRQRFRAVATFRDAANGLCREFEVDSPDNSTTISVACRHETGWRVTFAVVAPGDGGGYAPASSAEALDAYLGAIDALPPLGPEEEVEALAQIGSEISRQGE